MKSDLVLYRPIWPAIMKYGQLVIVLGMKEDITCLKGNISMLKMS